ncbi:MAG: serine recombinase [Caulobacteraceae bacterium]|nr:serine recombinase [Caulobacteraceae bacterium]
MVGVRDLSRRDRPAAQYVRMSTDQQQQSIENQINAINEFARGNGFCVVKTYSDPGQSGLTLRNRPGLQQLLKDVEEGPGFEAVLIYDVSRLGRFQELDEAAAYEFHMRVHGVEVVYCLEQFDNSGGPVNALLKHMKRSMAAEYSRDLSLRISRAKRLAASKGYWPGGCAPLGFERWACAADGRRMKLLNGERRYAYQWRTRLEPGPPENVALVRRIFDLYVSKRRTLREIARTLNEEGWRRRDGEPWYGVDLRKTLSNPIYGGDLVYGRTRCRLGSGQTPVPEPDWLRLEGAVPAIVPRKQFDAAQAQLKLRRRPSRLSDDELIAKLIPLYKRRGRLSYALINADKTIPSASYYVQRFGDIGEAISRAGYNPNYRASRLERMRRVTQLRTLLTGRVRLVLADRGIRTEAITPNHFAVGNVTTTCLAAVRPVDADRTSWRASVPERWIDLLAVAQMPDEGEEPIGYRVLRRDSVRQGHLYFGPTLYGVSTHHTTIDEAADRLIVLAQTL